MERNTRPNDRGESQGLQVTAWAVLGVFLAVMGLLGHIEGLQ